jgi:hypothetical protein
MHDNGYNVSCLFNAYSEVKFGNAITSNYDGFKNILADSGGLQVITLGKEITSEVKDQIYKTQAEFSTTAMSFDEIPVVTKSSSGSKRNDNSSRTFVHSMLEPCAIKSGKNLNEQIEAFKKYGSSSKPMLIAQGNDRHSIAKWVDIVYNTVDKENRRYIHGIAFAFSSIGTGVLEALEVCAAYGLIPYNEIKRNIHLLGVGAIKKLVPFIECFRSGFFPADTMLSFDSTSHSQGVVMGFYQREDMEIVRVGKYPNKTNFDYLTKVYNKIKEHCDVDVGFDEFYDFVIRNITTTKHLKEAEGDLAVMANLLYPFSTFIQVQHMIDAITDCHASFDNYAKYMSKKNFRAIQSLRLLKDVKDNNDFEKWFSKYARYTQSDRIKSDKQEVITLF